MVISSYPSFFFLNISWTLHVCGLPLSNVKTHTDDAFSKRLVKERRSPLFRHLRVQCPCAVGERLALLFNLFFSEFQIFFIFFLLKLSAVCTFWIVLICWYQKWFLKNKKTSLACISARKAIWKATTTTLPNTLLRLKAERSVWVSFFSDASFYWMPCLRNRNRIFLISIIYLI